MNYEVYPSAFSLHTLAFIIYFNGTDGARTRNFRRDRAVL